MILALTLSITLTLVLNLFSPIGDRNRFAVQSLAVMWARPKSQRQRLQAYGQSRN